MSKIRIAIAGVGNCASSLLQGLEYYRNHSAEALAGLMHPSIDGWGVTDVEVVAAFDVDRRKVGLPVEQAIFARPNCTKVFQRALPVSDVLVEKGPVLDGVPAHMEDYPEDQAFRVSEAEPVDVARRLRETGAEVLVCYLPVGSEQAVRYYAEACLAAKVGMVNCVPVFIASDPAWAARFREAGVPIVGDDIKSQVGATITHRALTRLFGDRGVKLDRTYQLNVGGNTDFLNMLERSRLQSKKKSKTESVQSQLDSRLEDAAIHIGPSDYVPWHNDKKVAFIRMEGRGFGDVPMELELRLSVEDSPNSAGVVIDALRCVKVGLDRGIGGPLEAPSSYYMKSPPLQVRDSVAHDLTNAFIGGASPKLPRDKVVGGKPAIVTTASTRRPDGQPRSALILAAGTGSRLFPNATLPKPLAPIQGITLAERVIGTLRRAAGIERFVVSLGHEAETVRPHFQSVAARNGVAIEFVQADDWAKGNGASTLAAAEALADGPFLLSMCDHLYDDELPARLVEAPLPQDGMALACDFVKEEILDLDGVMKVKAGDGRIAAIAKTVGEWDCADTGVMVCTPAIFEALSEAAAGGRHGLADGVAVLASRGLASIVDVTGCWWADIDTPEAVRLAEEHASADELRAAG
ncbi:NTP transferase domain-containing protein [Tistlia consotensis]|uniref:Myo-inositol-1-phosphate synthase n=2 Tax=Tistlia TaxID=1321364 RepID=A0A1Y6CRS8_9PROT|nr:NTP transferase domain-containing protein [Tistlia consotensis]SMF84016.1 Myo-inositol-1-phosphate synthase [Tistlia consotensis USBA 355]